MFIWIRVGMELEIPFICPRNCKFRGAKNVLFGICNPEPR